MLHQDGPKVLSGIETGLRCAMARCRNEQDKLKETAQPAESEVYVPRKDLPEQEEHIICRRKPLPMHPRQDLNIYYAMNNMYNSYRMYNSV